jgi:hypothetical protein
MEVHEEIRAAAWEIAIRITPRPWDVRDVKPDADRIAKYLSGGEGPDWEVRYAALDLHTTALGLHPRHLAGTARAGDRAVGRGTAPNVDAADVIDTARRIVDWITERRDR